jgi:hypothetical protein
VELQTLYAPYFPTVAFVAIPSQPVGSAPHAFTNKVAISLLLIPGFATHVRDEYMQLQRTAFGDGGRVSEANHVEPVAGHDRAIVFVGV